jgi:hypothetical protein
VLRYGVVFLRGFVSSRARARAGGPVPAFLGGSTWAASASRSADAGVPRNFREVSKVCVDRTRIPPRREASNSWCFKSVVCYILVRLRSEKANVFAQVT